MEEYEAGYSTYKSLADKYGVSPSVAKRAVYRSTKSLEYVKAHKC